VAIATSLDAPSPLSCCATASIATLPPLLPRQCLSHCASLAPAVGCCIVTSLAAPVPLLSCRRLSRCSATSLVALWLVATRHRRCPPRLQRSFFLHDFAPPPAIVRPWPRQRRRCGIPAVIQFDAVIVIVIVVIQGLDILCCGHRHLSRCAVSSRSLRHRLYRHAAATIAAPTPVSLRLSRANGWLLHRHLSRCTSASLVVPTSLSLLRHLSCCAAASLLVVPHLRRLVVASPIILMCRCLLCRSGWLLPCYLYLCAAVSLFATSLIAPQSLWVIEPLNPSKKRIGLLGGSSSINPTQRHGTKGLMWGARGQFLPAAAMVVMMFDVCSWPLVHVWP
jgi:hypothetical protein